ncbi:MAG: hypothetical protein RLZZ301_402 [Bacteroidota bacterium]|jgi:UDP-N-acetylmuramyl pentapeptide phosphotransferase/UDP-N-acetylglucosamine-1-phosphate transferase
MFHISTYHLLVFFLFFWGGFVLCYFLTPVVIQVVKIKRLYEKLSERSSHSQHVPSFGGVTFFVVFMISLTLAEQFFVTNRAVYIIPAATIMFVIGLKDDLTGISPINKIMAQIIATTLLFLSSDFQIDNLHGFLGLYEVSPLLVVPLSYAVVIFFINAFNLIDGIDGLATALGTYYFFFFALLYYRLEDWVMVSLCMAFVGMFVAFLRYNLSADKKIFMGDTGSLFIGFIIAMMVIGFMSTDYPAYTPGLYPQNIPFFIISVLFIPVFDSIRVFVARAAEGRSPFSPDRNHIHHLFMDRYGLTHRQTTLRILLLNIGITLLMWPVCKYLHQMQAALILLGFSFAFSLYLRSLRRSRN